MGIYTHYLDWLLSVTPSSQFFTITLFLFEQERRTLENATTGWWKSNGVDFTEDKTDSSTKTMAYLLSGKLDLNRVNGFLPTCF
jgi:hypothetical protein